MAPPFCCSSPTVDRTDGPRRGRRGTTVRPGRSTRTNRQTTIARRRMRVPHYSRALAAGTLTLGLLSLGACSGGTIRMGPATRDPFGGTSTSLIPDEPHRTTGTSGSNTRRVCRTVAVPAGWIVTEYHEVSETTCPSSREIDDRPKQRYREMTIVRYEGLAIGSSLDVCWDQSIPRGWHFDGSAQGRQCPREDASPSDMPTVRRITRDR